MIPLPACEDSRAARCHIITHVAITDHRYGFDLHSVATTCNPENFGQTLAESVRHVLWMVGDFEHGHQPGKFTEFLISALFVADPGNTARMSRAFAIYTALVTMAHKTDDGIRIMKLALEPLLEDQ